MSFAFANMTEKLIPISDFSQGKAGKTETAQKARPGEAGGPGRWRYGSRLRAWQAL